MVSAALSCSITVTALLFFARGEANGGNLTEGGSLCWCCSWAVWWVVGVDDFVAGVGFGDGVAAVVDVVVAQGAGEAHFVDVGESALFPGHDVVYFAAFWTCGAVFACAVPVTGDDGFDLGFGGESAVASDPDGLSFCRQRQPR